MVAFGRLAWRDIAGHRRAMRITYMASPGWRLLGLLLPNRYGAVCVAGLLGLGITRIRFSRLFTTTPTHPTRRRTEPWRASVPAPSSAGSCMQYAAVINGLTLLFHQGVGHHLPASPAGCGPADPLSGSLAGAARRQPVAAAAEANARRCNAGRARTDPNTMPNMTASALLRRRARPGLARFLHAGVLCLLGGSLTALLAWRTGAAMPPTRGP